MAFKLTYADGAAQIFEDEDSYRFNEVGLLLIETKAGRRVTMSPTAWSRIEEDAPPDGRAAGFG